MEFTLRNRFMREIFRGGPVRLAIVAWCSAELMYGVVC
jgi:hypothetical protein